MNPQTKTRYIIIAKLTQTHPDAPAVYREIIKTSAPELAEQARRIAAALGVKLKEAQK